jgi:subtilase family serine protease
MRKITFRDDREAMRRPSSVIAATALAAATLTAAAAGSAAQANASGLRAGHVGPVGQAGSGTAPLSDSAAPFATADRAIGSVPAANKLTIQLWLAPRTSAAEGYATAVSIPGNPLFRRFLSPAAYAARFAATPEASRTVESWLKSAGFTGVTTDQGRDYDPYATAVGATTLGIGHDNPRLFETGWSTGISAASHGQWVFQGEQGAAGGGASLLWKQPAYARGVVPNSLAVATGDRGGLVCTVPDISAVGDPFTGMAVGMLSFDVHGNVTGYFEESIGGTSLASPLVAGIVADAEQGSRAFGFINPALYKLAGTRAGAFPRPEGAVGRGAGQVPRRRL